MCNKLNWLNVTLIYCLHIDLKGIDIDLKDEAPCIILHWCREREEALELIAMMGYNSHESFQEALTWLLPWFLILLTEVLQLIRLKQLIINTHFDITEVIC